MHLKCLLCSKTTLKTKVHCSSTSLTVLLGDLIQVVLPSLKQFLGNIVDLRQDPQYIWIRLVVLLLKVPNLGSCLQWCETNL